MILFPSGIEISDVEVKILEHFLLDVEEHVSVVIQEKIGNRRGDMIKEAVDFFISEGVGTIPTDEDAIITQYTNHPKYKNRVARDEGLP